MEICEEMGEEASDEGTIGPAQVDRQCQKTLHCQSAHEGGDRDGWMIGWMDGKVDGGDEGCG